MLTREETFPKLYADADSDYRWLEGRQWFWAKLVRNIQKRAILTKTVNRIWSNRSNNNKTHVARKNDFEQNHFLSCPSPNYISKQVTLLFGLALFAGKGVWQGTDKLSNSWINFGYVAGHIAALIIISIQCQLQTNEGSPTQQRWGQKPT